MPLPLVYDGQKLEVGYRIDLIMEDQVVVEIKAVDAIAPDPKSSIAVLPSLERTIAGIAAQLQRSADERRHPPDAKWILNIHHRGTEKVLATE